MFDKQSLDFQVLASFAAKVKANNPSRIITRCNPSERDMELCKRYRLAPTRNSKHEFGKEIMNDTIRVVAVYACKTLRSGSILGTLEHETDIDG
jgi:hypothetical protein